MRLKLAENEQFLVFLLGFFSCILVFLVLFNVFPYLNIEKPLNLAGFSVNENDSLEAPGNWIKKEQITLIGDKIVIDLAGLGGVSLSNYAATGSMKPVLDVFSNGIRVVPDNEDEIGVGDIVTYRDNGQLIVHRVIEKARDEQGVYFVTQGDSNNVSDGVKLRFNDIEYVTIGVLW